VRHKKVVLNNEDMIRTIQRDVSDSKANKYAALESRKKGSELTHYINHLSAHRRKPIYYHIQRMMRKRFVSESKAIKHEDNITLKNYLEHTPYQYLSKAKLHNEMKEEFYETIKKSAGDYQVKTKKGYGKIDWANSLLYKNSVNEKLESNLNKNEKIYYDSEIDKIIKQLQDVNSNKELSKIHRKALFTLMILTNELSLKKLFSNFDSSNVSFQCLIVGDSGEYSRMFKVV